MMDSFAKCMEKATSEGKGVKSAAAKFFNLAATQDAKCQLETMHLAFRLPRRIRSREFCRLTTRGAQRKLLKASEVSEKTLETGVVTRGSHLEAYLARCQLPKPTASNLQHIHCVSKIPFWQMIMQEAQQETNDFEEAQVALPAAWGEFIQRVSWWEYRRLFQSSGKSLRLKPKPDVVIISPMPRLNKPDELSVHERHEIVIHMGKNMMQTITNILFLVLVLDMGDRCRYKSSPNIPM
jgi:hypothetical protein